MTANVDSVLRMLAGRTWAADSEEAWVTGVWRSDSAGAMVFRLRGGPLPSLCVSLREGEMWQEITADPDLLRPLIAALVVIPSDATEVGPVES